MSRRYPTPSLIVARYPGTCPETGKTWKAGDTIAWADRKAYHQESKVAEQIRGMAFATAYGMADANW